MITEVLATITDAITSAVDDTWPNPPEDVAEMILAALVTAGHLAEVPEMSGGAR